MTPYKNFLIKYGILASLLLGLYFGNVELQSYWGRQTLQKSGLLIHDYEEALKLARGSSKPVLLDVSAIWCPTCRRLDKLVLSDPAVNQLINEQYIFARVEYESREGETLLKKYNRTGFPNLLLLDGNGELLRPIELTFDPQKFIAQLR